jgi:hypothetical protein
MTEFVDVIHTATGVATEVPAGAVAFWLTRGYELAPDDGEGLSEQPFPYVRRIGDLSGNVTVEQLATLLGQLSPADLTSLRASLVGSASTDLDTLGELSDALGDDPNFATTILGLIGAKQAAATLIADGKPTIQGTSLVNALIFGGK